MAHIELNKLLKKGNTVISKKQFSVMLDVTVSAIDYAIANNKIDWTTVGREKVIVLSKKSLAYSPNSHPSRD